MAHIRRNITYICSFIVLVASLYTPLAIAAEPNLSDSYLSKTTITSGSLVSIDASNKGYVVPSNTNNASDLIGVVVPSNGSILQINPGASLTQVAVGGKTNVLVSTINGNINLGDAIGASPIDGVGMKSTNASRALGIALSSFNSSSTGATTQDITDSTGHKNLIYFGFISVQIVITPSGNAGAALETSFIQRLADSIAGHNVSTGPLIISTIIAFIALVSLIILIYGTIRGSLDGVARNPLAKWSIFQALAQVMAMASLIVVLSIIAIYLILR